MKARVICIRAGETAASSPVRPLKENKSGALGRPSQVEGKSMKLGHKLGIGCIGLIFVLFVLIMVVVIRNKPTPAQEAASGAQVAGYNAAFACQNAVRDRLKAPAGAEFQAPRHSEIVTLAAGRYQISSYVDAQNGFGAKVRTAYTCTAEKAGAGFRVMKLEIGRR